MAGAKAKRLDLAFHVHQIDRLDLDVEQRLDRSLDLLLVGVLCNLEDVLVVFLQAGALFRNVRRAQHAEQAFVLDFCGAHASHSSIFLTDSTVTTTLSASTRLTGSIAATSTTATCGRLSAERYRF